MSSVFEAGVSLACIVIIHNWFKEGVLGTISAFWFSAIYFQIILADTIYGLYREDETAAASALKLQSYLLFASYLVLSVICWFFFYHHPSHIGIRVQDSKGNSNNFGFNVDTTTQGFQKN